MLEVITKLVGERSFDFSCQVTSVDNFSLLLRAMLESNPQNQVLVHKILQKIVHFEDMDDIILEQSVLQAKSSPGVIQDMYAVRQEFIIPESSFL